MGDVKRLPFELFKFIYSRVPRLNVEVLIRSGIQVWLTKRAIEPQKGKWQMPGGTLLRKETSKEAAIRLAKEELNAEVKIGKLLGVIEYDHNHDIGLGFMGQPFGLVYEAELISDVDSLQIDDAASDFRLCTVLPKNTIEDQKKFLIKHLGFAVGKSR